MKNILILGANGYLGSKLGKYLYQSGYNPILLVRKSSVFKYVPRMVELGHIYYLEEGLDKVFLENSSIEAIVNASASYGRKGETPSQIHESNFLFPKKVYDFACSRSANVFINIDTVLPIDANEYALSKGLLREYLKSHCVIPIRNVLLEHFYGPGDDQSKFPNFLISSCLKNQHSIDLTSGTQKRDFVHVDDVTNALELLIRSAPNVNGNWIDVPLGVGETVSIIELCQYVKKITESCIILRFGAIDMRKNEPLHSCADISYLRNLGWEPRYKIYDGFKKVIGDEAALIDK